MNARQIMVGLSAVVAASLYADVPEVGDVTMEQSKTSREVTITYTLTNGPAIVTLDVETNGPNGWVSIGGENIQSISTDSDVWKKVSGKELYTIRWRPDLSWPDHRIADGGARAVVTAWALDNTPDYMVVDIGSGSAAGSVNFYPAVGFLPGGLLGGDVYRTSKIVMRKIHARGVTWKMGSVKEDGRNATREAVHNVTFDENYYIGVFPVTQSQWALVKTDNPAPSYFKLEGCKSMRPVEQVSYNEIRNSANSTADTTHDWPAKPADGSFLGLLRTKTGILFDLPSEAQWEYACRAGNGEGLWGDGSYYQAWDKDTNLPGRYGRNGGKMNADGTGDPDQFCDDSHATAIVGSYAQNDWGLYDMHGNVFEWCLDWLEDNIVNFGGAVNIDKNNSAKTLSGANGSSRVLRGASWSSQNALSCRSAYRGADTPNKTDKTFGFRLACPVGL